MHTLTDWLCRRCNRRSRIRNVLQRDLIYYDQLGLSSARVDEIAENIERVL